MLVKAILPPLAIIIPFTSTVYADLIVEYETANSAANPTLLASSSHPSITAHAMSAGSGIEPYTGTSSTWNWKNWDTASTSFDAAVAAGDYWTWGFDVSAPVTINLSTMDIRLDRSGTGPDDFEISAAVNGGGAISLLSHDFKDSDDDVLFSAVDLSGVGPLVQGDSVVFMLGAFNSEGTTGTFDLENSTGSTDLQLYGSVTGSSVPEPSALALACVSLVALAGGTWRKRCGKAQSA